MAPLDAPLTGEHLLDAVTDAMVALHERYYHRPPAAAKAMLLQGELLVCVMGGVYTEVEKTLIELQRTREVTGARSAFQQAMEHQFTEAVERLSGRTVLSYLSTFSVGPDLEIELFFLEPAEHPVGPASS